jgi:hypothetical protein
MVTDFQHGVDVLAFDGGLTGLLKNFSDITSRLTEVNGNAVITFGVNASITLVGVHASTLTASDFSIS